MIFEIAAIDINLPCNSAVSRQDTLKWNRLTANGISLWPLSHLKTDIEIGIQPLGWWSSNVIQKIHSINAPENQALVYQYAMFMKCLDSCILHRSEVILKLSNS